MHGLGLEVLFNSSNILRLLEGLWVTIKIASVAMIISCLLGTIFGVVMLSRNRAIRIISRIYLECIRVIPILVWLFIFYFGITKSLNIRLSGEMVCVIVFSMWGIAELGDIVRGSILSLPKHQFQSGLAIGLSDIGVYRYVIIPQAIRRMLPAAINLATRMIKTTSLAVLIGVVEVVKTGQQIIEVSLFNNNPMASVWIYGFIFILYFIICYPISMLASKLERVYGVGV